MGNRRRESCKCWRSNPTIAVIQLLTENCCQELKIVPKDQANSRPRNFDVLASETILQLKQKVERKLGYAAERQDLLYDNRRLRDDYTVGQYRKYHEAEIILRVKISLNIKYSFYDTITLNDLKNLFPNKSLYWGDLNLKYQDPGTYLSDIGIEDGSTIKIE